MMGILTGFLGEFWKEILAGLGAVVGLFMARRSGVKSEQAKQVKRDMKRAREIEEEVDDALRRHDGDTRPVDERLRERGRLRDD